MSRQIPSQIIVGCTLVLLLLACDVLQPAPTPDAIATSVAGTKTAWAEETAVRATLVAEMPVVTLTPTPVPPNATFTPAPTRTLIPISVSAPPTTTPKRVGFGMNEPIEGGEWRIIVLSAENKGTGITHSAGFQIQTLAVTAANQHFLLVTVVLEQMNGKPIELNYRQQGESLRQVVVRDDTGKTYMVFASGPNTAGPYVTTYFKPDDMISILFQPKDTIDYIFTVPDNASIIDFIWSDLPPARLQIR